MASVITTTATTTLSPLHARYLALIADGLTDQQIADQVHTTYTAARAHVARLQERLGATNRAHAVAIGYRTGLLTLEDA